MTYDDEVAEFKRLMKVRRELLSFCKAFIAEQRIYSEECIYQTDRVIENAYSFIAGVCDIVGYYEEEQ